MRVRRLEPAELEWANARYREVDFLPSSAADFIAVAEDAAGERLGLGRLVAVGAGSGELGGMVVLPAFRGQGVAEALVGYLTAHSPYAALFCLPFTHLEGFYRRHGFAAVPVGVAIPDPVAAKLRWCREHYPQSVSLLLRCRGKAAAAP